MWFSGFKMGGSSFNSLSVIFKQYKLIGPNYIDWKRNLDIYWLLKSTNLCSLKYVLSNLVMRQPMRKLRLTRSGRKLMRWRGITSWLQCQVCATLASRYSTAYNMVMSLKEMFGDQNSVARQVVMRELINTNMIEGTPVRDQVLKMMSHLNEVEILGAEIDGETQVDIML